MPSTDPRSPPVLQVGAMLLGTIAVIVGLHGHRYGVAIGGMVIAGLAALYWNVRD